MKQSILYILALILFVSCNSNKSENNESSEPAAPIIGTCKITSLDNLESKSYSTILYNEFQQVTEVIHELFSYGDTTINSYAIEHTENGYIAKVYWLDSCSTKDNSNTDNVFVEVNYDHEKTSSIVYENVIIKDFKYDDERIISFKYYYQVDNISDKSRTRLLEFSYDKTGNVVSLTDRRVNDGYLLSDVAIYYDTLCNPFHNSVLSLVPEFDLLAFISPNNWIETKSIESLDTKDSREIKYNREGSLQSLKTEFEHGVIEHDSIFYK